MENRGLIQDDGCMGVLTLFLRHVTSRHDLILLILRTHLELPRL